MLVSRELTVLTNAIAFNFLLCLFPLLMVVAGLSERLPFGRRAGGALLLLLGELIPFGGVTMAESLRGLTRSARGVELASLTLIVWGSSGIFMPVEMALNKAWGGDRAHRVFWKSRVLAFLMTVAGGVLALFSVALTVAARAYAREWPLLAGLGVKACAFSLTCLLLFLIYRVIPDVPVGARVAARAALVGGCAWEAAKYAFLANLGRMNLSAFYGPLAFAVSLVLWAYVSSLALVFGALVTPAEEPRRKG
jgi:membrane protein